MLAFQGISKVAKATKTRIDLQAPAEQIAEWREEAEANGMDLSNWIRYALNKMRRLERAERADLNNKAAGNRRPTANTEMHKPK